MIFIRHIFSGTAIQTCCASNTRVLCCRISLLAMLLSTFPCEGVAQDRLFGSVDDPLEQVAGPTSSNILRAEVGAGFSLVGPQWYTGAWLNLAQKGRQHYVELSGMVRAGLYGAYEPDTDELYDLARIINVFRLESRNKKAYARIGPLSRTRFGVGHLVNFLSTDAVYDERTVGVEARVSSPFMSVEFFSEDMFAVGLVGGRVSIKPFANRRSRLNTLSLGASVVLDNTRRLAPESTFDGQEWDIRLEAYETGGFSFYPFLSVARLPQFGQGVAFGAEVVNDNFIDFARIHFKLALHYNSSDFRSGYFGTFYTVGSHRAQILSENESTPAGYNLRQVERGNSIETEMRVMIFNRFEFWYAFLRYHGVQPLSEYHLRLMFTSRRFNLSIGQDRRGLVGFKSLFGSLGDENRMRFVFEYRIFGPIWAHVNADYTYLELFESVDNIPQHIIQRRFSPMVILRYPSTSR